MRRDNVTSDCREAWSKTIGKIKKKLSGSQSLFDFGFKRAKQDDDIGNQSVKKSDG